MTLLRPDLPKIAEEVNSKNTLNSFFPVRTKDRPGVFDWDSVLGHVVKTSFRKELGKGGIDEFKLLCQNTFLAKLDEDDFWSIVEQMYFEADDLFKIAPEFLLFKAQKTAGSTPNARLGRMFSSLLQNFFFRDIP